MYFYVVYFFAILFMPLSSDVVGKGIVLGCLLSHLSDEIVLL